MRKDTYFRKTKEIARKAASTKVDLSDVRLNRSGTIGTEPMATADGKRYTELKLGKLGAVPLKKPNFVTKMKNGVINATANVLSAPAQLNAKRNMLRADADTKALKTARSYDNAPDFNDDGSVTDAFKARMVAEEVKQRLKKRK